MDNGLLEKLAELEHEQWMAWSRAVSGEVSDDVRRLWQVNWVPYHELPEQVKELDREWARKVLAILTPAASG